jgi:hypothetical protein
MYQEIIKEAKSDFTKALKCNPIYAKTQEKVIELIDLYWVDKYKDNEFNELGVKKAFYNIIENPPILLSLLVVRQRTSPMDEEQEELRWKDIRSTA